MQQTDSVPESIITREEISEIIQSELHAYDKACCLDGMSEPSSDSDDDFDDDDDDDNDDEF